MSLHLQRQISNLKKQILELGAMVEDNYERAIQAVEERDSDLAEQIIAADREIDLKEIDVEEECLHTLALHQPVAFDIRFVIAVLKINNDLERIGDLAVNIAEQARLLVREERLEQWPYDLIAMAGKAQWMIANCLDALVNIDVELATKVREADDDVDALHRQAYERVQALLREGTEYSDQLIHLLTIGRHIERVADHAVNVAKDVIYMAKGDIVRHNRRAKKLADAGQ